jgi:hypothetical protein
MRLSSVLLVLLAAACAGCSSPRLYWDDYPDKNVAIDLRPGDYEKNAGFEAMPMSSPPHAPVDTVPDRPWVEPRLEVRPVHPEVTPIDPARLAKLLPAAPEGWTAEEANGVSVPTSQGVLSEGSRNYWKGAPSRAAVPTPDGRDLFPSIGITIIDRGQTGPDVADPTDERRGVTFKPVTVEGYSGDEFTAGPGFKQLDLNVGPRMHVRVRGGHVTPEELRAWAARLPLKEIAGL